MSEPTIRDLREMIEGVPDTQRVYVCDYFCSMCGFPYNPKRLVSLAVDQSSVNESYFDTEPAAEPSCPGTCV